MLVSVEETSRISDCFFSFSRRKSVLIYTTYFETDGSKVILYPYNDSTLEMVLRWKTTERKCGIGYINATPIPRGRAHGKSTPTRIM